MRQVPEYAIVGNGKLARHLAHYFKLSEIPYLHWHRNLVRPRLPKSNVSLESVITDCNTILILINDMEIDPFIQAHPEIHGKTLIHCSGAYQSAYAYSCHPLMTFGEELYELEQYQKIAFILDDSSPDFNILFPALPNPWRKIPAELKSYYHALCVIANNFTTLLWQKFFNDLENKLHIPKSLAVPLLQQTLHNILIDHNSSLTGPLARNDIKTIEKNLQALTDDPFHDVYQAFVQAYQQSHFKES